MFSVIVPVFNKSKYIEKCLNSILNQTLKDFEIIVVNDGSTDDSAAIVKKIIHIYTEHQLPDLKTGNSGKNQINPDKHVSIKLVNQVNSGVSIARNNGVKAAKYGYIAFLDADDWWEPTYLEDMKSLIEDFPEAGIYGSNYYLVKNRRKRFSTIGVEKDFEKGLINFCQVYAKNLCMPLWTGATVMRKAIFESFDGFKQELKFGEDFDLWIRVALKYPVAFLNTPLSNYNQDVEQKSRAIGNLHNPENHMLWNLGFLSGEEMNNSSLKQLLDKLRVYSLFPYFLSNEYHEHALIELKKVDWSRQPVSEKRLYNLPLPILKFGYQYKFYGSRIKQSLIRCFQQTRFLNAIIKTSD